MGPMSKKKRKTPLAGAVTAPAKRQKLTAAKSSSKPPKKSTVNIDSLQWKPVEITEMFDDAEGFYNLEMIDGVDIVKDGDNIEFHAVDAVVKSDDASTGYDDDEEFEGFSDSEKTPEEATKPADTQKTAKKVKNVAGLNGAADVTDMANDKDETAELTETNPAEESKPLAKKEKRKKARQTTEDASLESNVFAGLDSEQQDETVEMSAWAALNLSSDVTSSLAKLKYGKPTAIQSAAIPEILAGHDVIGKASTGSGKTLAFGIPIVEKWIEKERQDADDSSEEHSPLALVVSPTRELAHQLVDHIKNLGAGLLSSPYVCSVTGGLSVYKQQRQLEKADIVVGTPGRLWEVLSTSNKLMASFKGIRYLVIDEADRILTEGHFKEAEEVFKALDRHVTEENDDDDDDDESKLAPRQTLVFSATFHKGLQQKLAGKGKSGLMSEEESMEYLLKRVNFREEKPKFIDVNPVSQMAEGLKEGIIECGAMEKDLYLYTLLLLNPNRRSLVFTNSISTARRLTPFLQNLNLNALPLHSQMPQKSRMRSVERFTASKPGVAATLIATDVAARGLDIKGIEQVIHYHVPRAADMYVHRSGRTARASTSGISVLLCAPDEVTPVRRLAAKVHHEQAGRKQYMIRTLDVDRRIAGRLKGRVDLAKRLADAVQAKEKGGKDDEWMKQAAEDLGVEYDSEELEKSGTWGGRGSQRKQKQKEARGLTKAELGAMRAQLKELLAKRINAGVSERYITGSSVDIEELLRGAKGDFLGKVDGLGFDDL